MNGFGLLVLLAAGQITGGKATAGDTDYGWQVNPKDNVLEYIVQISPDEVREMQRRSVQFPSGREHASDMPPELVGRVSRIVVSIGTEKLPQSPPLDEIKRRFPLLGSADEVTASLGPGRFSEVEPSDVVPVQGSSSMPPLPSGGMSGSKSGYPDAGSTQRSLADQASDYARAAGEVPAPSGTRPGSNSGYGDSGYGDSGFDSSGRSTTGPGGTSSSGSKFDSPGGAAQGNGRLADRFLNGAGNSSANRDSSLGSSYGKSNQYGRGSLADQNGNSLRSGSSDASSDRFGDDARQRDPRNWDRSDSSSTRTSDNRNREYASGVIGNRGDYASNIPPSLANGAYDQRSQQQRSPLSTFGGSPSGVYGGERSGQSNFANNGSGNNRYGSPGYGGDSGYDGMRYAGVDGIGSRSGSGNVGRPSEGMSPIGNGNESYPSTGTPQPGYGGRGYPSTNGTQTPYVNGSQPGSNQQPVRVAANPNAAGQGNYPGAAGQRGSGNAGGTQGGLASGNTTGQGSSAAVDPNSSATGLQNVTGQAGASGGSPSDLSQSSSKTKRQNSGDGILQVFFLLSLVVNIYLGVLIRKLLGRYRSLLSSVRSQVA